MRRIAFPVGVLAFLLVFASPVRAASLSFVLDFFYDGAKPPGLTPMLTAQFDEISATEVSLTLAGSGLSGGTSVGSWFFNFDPSIVYLAAPGGSGPAADVTIGKNSQDAGTETGFDIKIVFTDKFGDGQKGIYLFKILDAGSTLLASSFDFVNQGGAFFSAAELLGVSSGGSSWIAATKDKGPPLGPDSSPGTAPIPEPATLLLLGAGLSGLVLFGRGRLTK